MPDFGHAAETESVGTNYEAVVPANVREHTEALMARWRDDGRPDDEIEHLVKSAVLNAYAEARRG